MKFTFIFLLLSLLFALSPLRYAQKYDQHITIKRGDYKEFVFRHTGNVTASDITFVVKLTKSFSSPRLIQKANDDTTEISTIYTSPYTYIRVKLLQSDTRDFTSAKYFYDIVADSTTIFDGELRVQQDVQTPFDGTTPPTSGVRFYVAGTFIDTTVSDGSVFVWDSTAQTLSAISKDSLLSVLDLPDNLNSISTGNFGAHSITVSQDNIDCNGNTNLLRSMDVQQTAGTIQTGGATGNDEELDNVYEAIKFTSSYTGRVGSLSIMLKKTGTITNTTQYITAWLYSDNAGVPGTKLQTAVFVYTRFGNLTNGYVEYSFLPGISDIVSGTSYWIVLQRSAAPVGGSVYLQRGNAGTGIYAYSSNATDWTLENNKNPTFTLYTKSSSAIYGYSQNYAGLFGESRDYHGIRATSVNDFGGLISSVNSIGLVATSNYSAGLYGSSVDGAGTYGISTNGNGIYGQSTAGYGGYFESVSNYGINSITTSGQAFNGQINPSSTNTVASIMYLRRLTSGTAANDIGGSIDFITENASGSGQFSGRIISKWVNATTMDARLSLANRHSDGSLYEDLYLDSDGATNIKNLRPQSNDTYYIGKNDDDDPYAFKGIILRDQGNGKYYRIEIINGTITATDLTD